MHERLSGHHKNPVKKRKWIEIQRLMIKAKLHEKWYPPPGGFQRLCAVICVSRQFEIFIYLVIFFNVIVLAMPYQGMSTEYSNLLEQMTFAFNIIYNVEAFIKLVGLKLRYF